MPRRPPGGGRSRPRGALQEASGDAIPNDTANSVRRMGLGLLAL